MIHPSLFWMMLFLGAREGKSYFDLVAVNANQYVLLVLKDRIKISFFDTTSGSSRRLFSDELIVEGDLIREFDSPAGPYEGPSHTLVGGNRNKLYFMLNGNRLEVFDRIERTWQSIQSKYPENVSHLWPNAQGYLAASGLVTRSGGDPCDRSFFAACSAEGTIVTCSGEGKPFMASFIEGDFPTCYYFEQQNSYGIYYRKSGDLFQFGQFQNKTQIDGGEPQTLGPGKENVFALDSVLVLSKITETEAAAFALEMNRWKLRVRRKGSFQKAVAVNGSLILLDQRGAIESIRLSTGTN